MATSPANKPPVRGVLKEAENLVATGQLKQAELLYTRSIEVEPSNPGIYSNRSLVRTKLGKCNLALLDAERSIELDQNYAMGYYSKGMALAGMEDFTSALVEFSNGLIRQQKNAELISGAIDVALQSKLKDTLHPILSQLKSMQLEQNAFIIVSVVGQELLSHGLLHESIQVLENALQIGTRSLKLKGSVYSALSSALWSLGETERAIAYMQEDLSVARQLADIVGECRAHGNLGAAYFSQRNYQHARESHNRQLALAQRMNDNRSQLSAWSSIGHVQSAVGDNIGAIESHKHAASLSEKLEDKSARCRELGLLGNCYLAIDNITSALQCHSERLRVAMSNQTGESFQLEVCKAYMDVANIHHKMERFENEIACLQKSCSIAEHLSDRALESQILASLGHVARQTGNLKLAKQTYERLLEIALTSQNFQLEAKACANLGVIHHQIGDYEMALKLQARNLEIGEECRDIASQGRAHGNIGNAYSAMGLYAQAVKHHLKELEISQNIGDKMSECSTHGNLAVAFQALNQEQNALEHYQQQMELARENHDEVNELRAYLNMANYYSSNKKYSNAIPLYEAYLQTCSTSSNINLPEVARVNYNIAFAHFSLRNFEDAVKHYNVNLELCTKLNDKDGMARSFCNIGLAWKELGKLDEALNCQNSYLTLCKENDNAKGTYKALNNIGEIYMTLKQPLNAKKCFKEQHDLSMSLEDSTLIAQSHGSLGTACKMCGEYTQAIQHHSMELQFYTDAKNAKSVFKAHGKLAEVYALANDDHMAIKHYQQQLNIAKENKDVKGQTHALWCLGASEINLNRQNEAIEYFHEQLKLISDESEKGAVLCVIGECYERLTNYTTAKSHFEKCLKIAESTSDNILLEKSLQGLQSVSMNSKDITAALFYGNKRTTVCAEMQNTALLATAWNDIINIYMRQGSYKKCLSCLTELLRVVEAENDLLQVKLNALLLSAKINIKLHRFESAIECCESCLSLGCMDQEQQGQTQGQMGLLLSNIGQHSVAIQHYEQQLFASESTTDIVGKIESLIGIAGSLLRSGADHARAVLLLQQASVLIKQEKLSPLLSCKLNLEHAIAVWRNGDTNLVEGLLHRTIHECEEYTANKSQSDPDFMEYYELITKCNAALIVFYVTMDQHQRALGAVERMKQLLNAMMRNNPIPSIEDLEILVDAMVERSCSNDTTIIYYAIISGCLLAWVISPSNGLCAFAKHRLVSGNKNILAELIADLRNTLGIESHDEPCDTVVSFKRHDTVFTDCILAQLSIASDASLLGFLVDEDDIFDASTSKSPIYALHRLLLSAFEAQLQHQYNTDKKSNLLFVVEPMLSSIPFGLLKKRANDAFLSRLFNVQITTSHHALKITKQSIIPPNVMQGAVVIGNPISLEATQSAHQSEDECNIVSSYLQVEPLVGTSAMKDNLLSMMRGSEVIHLACHVNHSEPISILVGTNPSLLEEDEQFPEDRDSLKYERSKTHCYMTMQEIMRLGFVNNKLVVIGAPYVQSSSDLDLIDSSFIMSQLVTGLSNAGAKSILMSLWPIPVIASKVFFHNFYKSMRSGMPSVKAFNSAIDVLCSMEQFQHPSYWAGFLLIGQNVTLDPNNLAMTHALAVLTESDPGHLHDTLRLVVHLIDKSLQRMNAPDVNHTIPMYTTQMSIAKKVREVTGWRELLSSARFQLRPSANGLPDAVFFPTQEDAEFLQSLKPTFISFLQLSVPSLISINRLFNSPLAAARLARAMKEALLSVEHEQIELEITRKTWQTDGTDDLLTSIGFNLSQINESEVKMSCFVEAGTLATIQNCLDVLKIFFGHVEIVGVDHGRDMSKDFTETGLNQVSKKAAAGINQIPTQEKNAQNDATITHSSIMDDLSTAFEHLGGKQVIEHIDENIAHSPAMRAFQPRQFTSKPIAQGIVIPKPIFPPSHSRVDSTPTAETKKMFYVDDAQSSQETEKRVPLKYRSNSFSIIDLEDDTSPRKVRTLNHDRSKSQDGAVKYVPSPSVARSISMRVPPSQDYRKIVGNLDRSAQGQQGLSRSFEDGLNDINNNQNMLNMTYPIIQRQRSENFVKNKEIPPDVYYTNGQQIQITKNSPGHSIIRPIPTKPKAYPPSKIPTLTSKPPNNNNSIRNLSLVQNLGSNGHIEFV